MQLLCNASFSLQLVAFGFPLFNLSGCLAFRHAPRISCSKSTNEDVERLIHSYSS
ncbi:hypothetical protein EDF71_1322 [Comamonas sp. JUb58]|nr:hypothetical protein EDF71_1322 [Comamonas sp. JUb58]